MSALILTNHLITTYPTMVYESNPITAWLITNTGWLGILAINISLWTLVFILFTRKWKLYQKVLFVTILSPILFFDLANNITVLWSVSA